MRRVSTSLWKPPVLRPLFCPECRNPFQPRGAGHRMDCSIGRGYKLPEMVKEGWLFLVFGGRNLRPDIPSKIHRFLDNVLAVHPDAVILQGGASGADHVAKQWALGHGVAIEEWKPQYRLLGRWLAPLWRNAEMAARKPEAALAVIGPCGGCNATYRHGSHGSVDTATRARGLGVPVYPMVWGELDELAAWIKGGS